jgi:hypothetical protein
VEDLLEAAVAGGRVDVLQYLQQHMNLSAAKLAVMLQVARALNKPAAAVWLQEQLERAQGGVVLGSMDTA